MLDGRRQRGARGKMELSTNRLLLRAFDLQIIHAAKNRNPALINCVSSSLWPENDLFEVISYFENLLSVNGVDGFNSWLILENNEIIGSAGFTSEPDDTGTIEIGFSILPSKRRMGYCNEAISALIDWAFSHDRVTNIIAHCKESNTASKSILQINHFAQTELSESLITWKRNRI